MAPDFFNLSYLENGSVLQRKGLAAICKTQVMETLRDFDPVLVGTLPLDLFVNDSDLDILCFGPDTFPVEKIIKKQFGNLTAFSIQTQSIGTVPTVIANFESEGFKFELFSQSVPTREQFGYRHLVIEYNLLKTHGESLREKVLALKRQGIKTEPAFAKVLGLSGDPYAALLQIA